MSTFSWRGFRRTEKISSLRIENYTENKQNIEVFRDEFVRRKSANIGFHAGLLYIVRFLREYVYGSLCEWSHPQVRHGLESYSLSRANCYNLQVTLVLQLIILLLSILLILLVLFNTYPVQTGQFRKIISKFKGYYATFAVYLTLTIILNSLKLDAIWQDPFDTDNDTDSENAETIVNLYNGRLLLKKLVT